MAWPFSPLTPFFLWGEDCPKACKESLWNLGECLGCRLAVIDPEGRKKISFLISGVFHGKKDGMTVPIHEKRPHDHGKDHPISLLVSRIVVLWCFSKRIEREERGGLDCEERERGRPEWRSKDHKTTIVERTGDRRPKQKTTASREDHGAGTES